MQALLAAGADPGLSTADETTPLMAAAGVRGLPAGSRRKAQPSDISAMVDSVRMAIDAGNEVNAVNGEGQTALHGAVRLGIDQVTQALLAKGARTDIKDKHGDTALTLAESTKSDATLNLLKQTTASRPPSLVR
jgi:ankyrin repeat protein